MASSPLEWPWTWFLILGIPAGSAFLDWRKTEDTGSALLAGGIGLLAALLFVTLVWLVYSRVRQAREELPAPTLRSIRRERSRR